MKCIEADAKTLLADAGIRVPAGTFLALEADPSASRAPFPLYAKAQVLSGRRGKRGLVRRCEDPRALKQALQEMREIVSGTPCAGFLLEPEIAFHALWLVSMDLDRSAGSIRATVSASGGADVYDARAVSVYAEADLAGLDAPDAVRDVLRKLLALFRKSDALSIEINPLAVLADGSCVALDAKVELDDQAAFRHPEWNAWRRLPATGRLPTEREAAYAQLLEAAGHRGTLGKYIEMDGDIALILSGGGASLLALDALAAAGGRAANYVEMSGNPDAESVRAASKIVLGKPGIRAVWIAGSFANFTDIRATVGAVLAAADDVHLRAPIVIRRDGPQTDAARDEALRWAVARGIDLRFDRAEMDLSDSADAVVAASHRV
jgi:succinyl-CoA synthetase beta subunit